MYAPVLFRGKDMLPDRQVILIAVDELEGQHCLLMIPKIGRVTFFGLPATVELVAGSARSLREQGRQRRLPAPALPAECTSRNPESGAASLPGARAFAE